MSQAVSIDPSDAVHSELSALIASRGLPGVAVAAGIGDVELAVAAGLSSARGDTALSVDHCLPISCVMKVLVSLIVLHGHETGVMDWDSDIAEFVPEVAGGQGDTGITIRHLLTQTAGYIEPQENSARWGYTWERFVDFFPHRKQAFVPGTVWSYCHTAYALLQKAAEAAYGRDIDDLLDDLIFAQLGFWPQNFGVLLAKAPNVMTLHVKSSRSGLYEPMRPPTETGFLRYSISDLALSTAQLKAFAQALSGRSGALAHLEGARKRLLTPFTRLPAYVLGRHGEAMPYGYCHGVADYGAVKGINGSYVGSTCAIRFDEAEGFGIAAAVNAWSPNARDVAAERVTSRLLGGGTKTTPRAPPVFEDLSALAGEYEGLMLGSASFLVSRDGPSLVCTVNRRGLPPLLGRVARGPDGRLTLVQGGGEMSIAFAEGPDREPIAMVGSSACRKLAA